MSRYLRYRYGSRPQTLYYGCGGFVPVLLKDGGVQRVPWAGFIEADKVRNRSSARPVKLVVDLISPSLLPDQHHSGNVYEGQYVQGALIKGRAYAVISQAVTLVQGPKCRDGMFIRHENGH